MCVVPSVIVLLITALIVFRREIVEFSLPASRFLLGLKRASELPERSRRQPA